LAVISLYLRALTLTGFKVKQPATVVVLALASLGNATKLVLFLCYRVAQSTASVVVSLQTTSLMKETLYLDSKSIIGKEVLCMLPDEALLFRQQVQGSML
jgi:hypothetical protein